VKQFPAPFVQLVRQDFIVLWLHLYAPQLPWTTTQAPLLHAL
jgi:hypothetical protein